MRVTLPLLEKDSAMSTLVKIVTAGDDAAPAAVPGLSREERNRQRRAWRNSPANPRNKSRGGPRAAWYDHGP
jgi:hypothetical protein